MLSMGWWVGVGVCCLIRFAMSLRDYRPLFDGCQSCVEIVRKLTLRIESSAIVETEAVSVINRYRASGKLGRMLKILELVTAHTNALSTDMVELMVRCDWPSALHVPLAAICVVSIAKYANCLGRDKTSRRRFLASCGELRCAIPPLLLRPSSG